MLLKKCFNEKLLKKLTSSVNKAKHTNLTETNFLFLADNRRKIQRKRAKTMDYTALVKRPVKGDKPNFLCRETNINLESRVALLRVGTG
jgi:hypothetical protein